MQLEGDLLDRHATLEKNSLCVQIHVPPWCGTFHQNLPPTRPVASLGAGSPPIPSAFDKCLVWLETASHGLAHTAKGEGSSQTWQEGVFLP